jgi:hypothetical protein
VVVVVIVVRFSLVVGLFDWAISPSFKTSKEIDDEDDHDDEEEEDEHDDEVDALSPWEFIEGCITRRKNAGW